MKPLIITVAPLGAEVDPAATPHLPYTPNQLAQTARACEVEGAAIIHVHCRDDLGKNTHALERFREVTDAIRAVSSLVVQYSTGGAIGMTPEERAAPLELLPEMASLTCGTVNFGDEIFENPMPLMRSLARTMRRYDIKPELEIFDKGHLANARRLAAEDLLCTPAHVDFVLGVPGALEGTATNLVDLVRDLPADWTWSVAGIGRAEFPLAAIAIAMGGHVRVGLEDNLYLERGRLARNEELVARIARIAKELGRPLASPTEAREILALRTAGGK
jgi:3-keto-5-aminohexanoate cleavage enzyme